MRFMVKERKANSEGQKEYGPKALKMQIKVATHSHRHLYEHDHSQAHMGTNNSSSTMQQK